MSALLQRIAKDIREALAATPSNDERYLAQATNIVELEQRMRALERGSGLRQI